MKLLNILPEIILQIFVVFIILLCTYTPVIASDLYTESRSAFDNGDKIQAYGLLTAYLHSEPLDSSWKNKVKELQNKLLQQIQSKCTSLVTTVRYSGGDHIYPNKPIKSEMIFSNLRLMNTAEYFGNESWKWTVFVEGSVKYLKYIKSVTYDLRPHFDDVYPGDNSFSNHPFTARGWGTFKLHATITLLNGQSRRYNHQLIFN